jgi:two-component system, LuxR family, sensor kinase FixL
MGRPSRAILRAWQIAVIYAAVAGLWVVLSDWLLVMLVSDPAQLTGLQTAKGWGFVVVTSLILFTLVRQATRDIERAAEDARAEEERTRSIVDSTVDGIITIDEHGVMQSFNPAAERIFGYAAADVLGRNVSMLMPEPDRDRHDQYIEHYLRTGRAKIIGIGREVVGQRSDGTVFPIDLAVSEFSHNGRRMFTGIVRDISERVDLQREVLDASSLEQRRIGQDLHDGLGQDLTGIAMLTNVVHTSLRRRDDSEADKVAEIADLADRARSHLRSLVKGLSPVSLGGDGFMVAMRDLTSTAEELFGITCRLECDTPVVVGDIGVATHLYYIAREALNNAVQHGGADSVVVSISLDSGQITMSIEDNGVGLPDDWRRREGNGLRIMRYRAKMIGGSFDLRPASPRGTVVTITGRIATGADR